MSQSGGAGSGNKRHRLDPEVIAAIRAEPEGERGYLSRLAVKYGVTVATITRVRKHETGVAIGDPRPAAPPPPEIRVDPQSRASLTIALGDTADRLAEVIAENVDHLKASRDFGFRGAKTAAASRALRDLAEGAAALKQTGALAGMTDDELLTALRERAEGKTSEPSEPSSKEN